MCRAFIIDPPAYILMNAIPLKVRTAILILRAIEWIGAKFDLIYEVTPDLIPWYALAPSAPMQTNFNVSW